MVFYTPMDMIKQLMAYEKALGLEFDGKKVDDCITEVQDNCPHIFSDDELKGMCRNNLLEIQKKYGYRGVRVWFHNAKKNLMLKSLMRDEDGFGGDDPIERKYHKLIPDVWKFHNSLLFESDYFLNTMLYYRMLEEVYWEMYGSLMEMDYIDHKCNELYHIMKTVHMAYYDVDVVKSLLPTIRNYLIYYNCQYYLSLDLTETVNLEELYLHLAEENFDSDAYEGFTIFHSNDGWGNTIFDKWEHTTNPDGSTTSRLDNPKSTFEDYNPKGTVFD